MNKLGTWIGSCGALLLFPAPAFAAWHCPPLTAAIASTHTRPEGGDKLLHVGELANVVLKADIRPDGGADINIRRSSGLTALNELAANWVRVHWRWPTGRTPGSTAEIQLEFFHRPGF